MVKILGWLTLGGLVVTALAIVANLIEVAYPVPITLLCLGAVCSLLSGIPWAHTPVSRGLKAAYLGLIGYAGGAALGLLLGWAVAPSGDKNLGIGIAFLIIGWWVGGILLASLGFWWGIRFHSRFAAEPGPAAGRHSGTHR
jgi:hypothetical protein